MKLKVKIRIIALLGLGIVFTLILGMNNSLNLKPNENDTLKTSKVSGRIHIIGSTGWTDFKNAGSCTGSGNYSDPYVIEDLIIDGGRAGSCIWIEDSDVYFRIENCTVYRSRDDWDYAGIRLFNVTNGITLIHTHTRLY